MDHTESTEDYEVYNQPSPPKNVQKEMGIQRKPQRSLQELLESQPGRGEEEAHRVAKQQKTSHVPTRGSESADIQLPEPQAWLLAPMLGGEPLMDDASIRDFNGGIGCHVASALEQTFLLPKDMVEL